MIPVLFSIGNFKLYSFGLMVAAGVFLSISLMTRQAKRDGFPDPEMVSDSVLVGVFAGFFGARLYYVIQNFSVYLNDPLSFFAVWEGGLVFYGGVIASFFALYLFARIKRISFIRLLDFMLPYVALTHAFGRVGCFLNGCCAGKACSLPWAVTFPETELAVHPVQLYEAGFNVLLFLFLLRAAKGKASFTGRTTVFYFIFYAVGRFTLEFFRTNDPYFLSLTMNQWVSIAIFAAAAALYVSLSRRKAE